MARKTPKKPELEEIIDAPETSPNAPQQTAVALLDANIVKPSVTPQQAAAQWKVYQELCNAILEPSDFLKLSTFGGPGKGMITKYFKVKSAWRKLATAFNLSVEIIKEVRKEYEDPKHFVVEITARVTAVNGRFMDGTGTCSSIERKFTHLEHDVRAQAETRAKNRAIADMIGGGEVSAEEVMAMEENKKEKCPQDHEKLPEKIVSTEGKNKGRPYKKCNKCTFFEWQDEEKES
jgi:hypothetical protein